MDMREVYVVAGSFVGFQLFFSCVSPVLSSNFSQGYGKLPPNKLNDWNSRYQLTPHCSNRNVGRNACMHGWVNKTNRDGLDWPLDTYGWINNHQTYTDID